MARFMKGRHLDKNVYDMTIERLHHIYDLFDHVAVSFSAGKDSTATLNTALEVARERGKLPLRVLFFDEEAIPTETVDYARRVAENPDVAFEWYCVPVQHRNGCSTDSPYWYPWAEEVRDLWVRELPPEAITEIPGYDPTEPEGRLTIPNLIGKMFDPAKVGTACVLLGIRADESITRRRAVSYRVHDNYIIPDSGDSSLKNLSKAYPIYDWSTQDVWTAPAQHGWDYNESYNLMEMAGIGHSHQRIAPPFGEQPMRSLWMYHVCFPDIWPAMTARVPGAATAARYAAGELYAAGSKESYQKPEGSTWQEAIRDAIESHPAEIRPKIAQRISSEIRNHNRKSGGQPVLEVPHPWTGVSWTWLYRVAVRGDFKNREIPEREAQDGTVERKKVREEYEAALERWEIAQHVSKT